MSIDDLSAEELRCLDAAGQIGLLNDLCREIAILAKMKRAAIDTHATARIAAIRAANDPESKAAVINAKRVVDGLSVTISARKEQAKILQTLLRSIPA